MVDVQSVDVEPLWRYWGGVLFAFAIAVAGGLAADHFEVPLPYMLGGLGATMFAAIIRLPVRVPPQWIIDPMRAALGVLIGSTMTPQLLAQIGSLGTALMFVPVYVVVCGYLGMLYYRWAEGLRRDEALFASLPGGLNTIVYFAEEMGMNIQRVALAQSLRLALVVIAVPFAVQFITGSTQGVSTDKVTMLADLEQLDLILLVATGAIGLALGKLLKVPGGVVIVPMLLSGASHMTGAITASPPIEIIILAQLVLGTHIGTKFSGVPLASIRTGILVSIGHMVLMLAITCAIAYALVVLVQGNFTTGFLAFAPGGVAEMSLVALGLGLDVGFIATLHVARIILIMIAAPWVYRIFKGWLTR